MSSVETLSVSLPAELIEAVRQAVAIGDFASADDVVQAALQDWQEQRDNGGYSTEELRALIQEGIDSGPAGPAEPVFEELRARIRTMQQIPDQAS